MIYPGLKPVFLLLAILALPAGMIAQNDEPAVRKLPEAFRRRIQFLNPEYLVFLPVAETNSKLPVLVFLHGAGGVGDDIKHARVMGKPSEIWIGMRKFGKGPAIVVAPQCLQQDANGERGIWKPEDLNVFLELLKATLPIDEHRIYLSGISMGGYGT